MLVGSIILLVLKEDSYCQYFNVTATLHMKSIFIPPPENQVERKDLHCQPEMITPESVCGATYKHFRLQGGCLDCSRSKCPVSVWFLCVPLPQRE